MNVPTGMPSISPVLFYRDITAASEWLCRAFGFTERTKDRVTDEHGVVQHAEIELGNGLIILSAPYAAFAVPDHGSKHHQLLYVFVDGVDTHASNAVEMGAEITNQLADTSYGARVYSAKDPFGYHWIFAEQLTT